MSLTDAQELEKREIIRKYLSAEIDGLQNDYAILLRNHGNSLQGVLFSLELRKKIDAFTQLLNYYKK